MNSNRLASVSAFLGVEEKTTLVPKMWIQAAAGNAKAIDYVVDHCVQDVIVLEQVYMRIRGLSTTHPNVALVTGSADTCPICGTVGKMHKRGFTIARATKKQRYHCQVCGGWSSGAPERTKGVIVR